MEEDSKNPTSDCAPAPRRGRAAKKRTFGPSSGSAKDVRIKSKDSPDRKTLSKRKCLSENLNTSEKDVKRDIRDAGEGPSVKKQRRKRFVLQKFYRETTSSSADKERSVISLTDRIQKGCKRKAAEGVRRRKKERIQDLSADAQRAEFEAKYDQENQLGEGGYGAVFAGYRKTDDLPVAIKHIPKNNVFCKHVDKNGKELSIEVAIMLKLAASANGSVGSSAPVSLLDWYDLDQELILVLERPVPAEDLFQYIQDNGGYLEEDEAKIILKQLLDAAIELQNQRIFHRDIKVENILIETSSDVPRVRIIDFGLSCFEKEGSSHSTFYGTAAHIPPEWYSECIYRAGPTTVWQLGVVLFEALHGASEAFETKEYIENRLTIRNELSTGCQNFLRTCLNETPQGRLTLQQLKLHSWLS